MCTSSDFRLSIRHLDYLLLQLWILLPIPEECVGVASCLPCVGVASCLPPVWAWLCALGVWFWERWILPLLVELLGITVKTPSSADPT